MDWLRWSYRIGFVIAVIAALVFVAAVVSTFSPIGLAGPPKSPALPGLPQVQTPPPVQDASLAMLISGVTCLVTTIGSFSTMILAWRLDRRQSREAAFRIAQLQVDLERSRQGTQVKVDQS
jgi:hypothetical protein